MGTIYYKDMEYAGASAGSGTQIIPNPTGSPTENLNKIQIDNDIYAIPSGGGSGSIVTITPSLQSGTKVADYSIDNVNGSLFAPTPTEVEANPSETALGGNLTKLKVGNSVYDIPSGGGSYTLPPATKTTLGGIKVGDTLSVDEYGLLNAIADGSLDAVEITAEAYELLPIEDKEDESKVYFVYDYPAEDVEIEINPQTLPTDNMETIRFGNTVYSVGSNGNVIANPSNPSTENLQKLQVGNKVYGLPPYVSANPQETALNRLDSLKIGNDIFEIVGSSGGNGVYASIDTLYSGNIDAIGTYELDDSIDNYDCVLVSGYNYNENNYHTQWVSLIIYKDDYYLTDTSSDSSVFLLAGYTSRRVGFKFTDSTHIRAGLFTQSGSGNPSINKVYGIKFINPNTYTTDERVVGKWIDGKPIYQKTVVLENGITISGNGTTFPSNSYPISMSDLGAFVDGCFATRFTSGNQGFAQINVWNDSGTLKIYPTVTWNNMTHFTFRYTKNTD